MKTIIPSQSLDITPKFKSFMHDILRYRCLLTQSVYDKCFDNPDSWALLRRAFFHKSLEIESYELLEHHGDVVLNLAVVEYIRDEFTEITSLDWNSGLKITFISNHFLAKTAVNYGFWKHIVFSEERLASFNYKEDPLADEDFLKANEDVFEAVCGSITQILNKKLTRGIGYNACFNMIKSFLDASEEVALFKNLFKIQDYATFYNHIIDAKTRLKETFDRKRWTVPQNTCTLSTNLNVFNISNEIIGNLQPKRQTAMNIYMRESKNAGLKIEQSILNSTDRFLILGYVCDAQGSLNSKRLAVARSSPSIKPAEQDVARILLEDMASKGISKPHTSPFKKF